MVADDTCGAEWGDGQSPIDSTHTCVLEAGHEGRHECFCGSTVEARLSEVVGDEA